MAAHAFAARPALAARYDEESRTLVARRLRLCCWLGVVLVPIFLAVDRILHPELLRTFVTIRLLMLTVTVLILAAMRVQAGVRLARPLSLAAFLATGIGIVVMTAFNGGGSSPYYAGLNLVMLAAAVLMPWDLDLSAPCCGILVIAYAASCALWGGVPDPRIFMANLFFLCSTAAITTVSHGVGERARQREFLQRVALEEAGRHRDEFLANVGHELRTPLSAIFGYCEMLGDYTPDATDEQRGWLARIHENASALYRLIVQILDFSAVESGALELARESVALAPVVRRVADELRNVAESPGVEVALAADAPSVTGDAARIEEIVSHLGTNAIKFSGGRPVTLQLGIGTLGGDPPWARIVPQPGPDTMRRRYVEIAVVDRGRGIEPDELRRLFIAFQQLDGSSTRRHEGTGLGLALSARLAEAMEAHIAVRSTPGAGSTFALLIPVRDEEVASADAAPATPGTDHAADAVAQASGDQPALAVLVGGR